MEIKGASVPKIKQILNLTKVFYVEISINWTHEK